MASGLCAVVTRSQVSKPAPVSNAPEPELPASKSDSAAQESAPVNDSAAQDSAPVNDVSDFQQRCSAAYDKDPLFKDESYTSQYTNKHGLWWASGDRLVIPNADALRHVMCELHDSPWHGHVGVTKTRKAIERLYTWPSLKDDVEQYVRTCPCCQRNKPTNQKPAGLLQPLPVPRGSGVVSVWI